MSIGKSALVVVAFALVVAACQSCRRPLAGEGGRTGPVGAAPRQTSPVPVPSPGTSERLGPEHLRYLGAFRLPDEFSWGARGMTYYPGGARAAGTLLITGSELPRNARGEECSSRADCRALYGEVTIPAPVVARSLDGLPRAQLVRPMTAFDGGRSADLNPTVSWVADIEYVPRRGSQAADTIYGALSSWYPEGEFGDDSFATIWSAALDGSRVRGLWHVGPKRPPFHGRKVGDYLFSVPQWYADRYLGGRILVTGRSRGTPVGMPTEGNTTGGSQGPTLFAFRASESDAPTDAALDALPMLYYRVFFPSCAGPNVGEKPRCDFPGFTMCDSWTGGAFVEAGTRQAIVLLGVKGLGPNCYDEPPVVCRDPCSDAHGYHCQPYERQVIFYDVAELGQRALGHGDRWSVLPYVTWRPQELLLGGHTCGDVGGLAFDAGGRRLFLIERGLGAPSENVAAVHVWSVAGR